MGDIVQWLAAPRGSEPSVELASDRIVGDRDRRDDAGLIDVGQLFAILVRQFFPIMATTLAMVGLAFLYILAATPQYTGTAQLLIDPRETKILKADAVLSGLGADKPVIESNVEVLRSQSIAERVLSDVGESKLLAPPKPGPLKQLFIILGLKKDPSEPVTAAPANPASATNGAPDDTPQSIVDWLKSLAGSSSQSAQQDAPVDDKQRALQVLHTGLEVAQKGRSFIIEVHFTHHNPLLAAKIANSYVESYLRDQIEDKLTVVRNANKWLKQQIAELREQVLAAEKKVEGYKAEHGIAVSDASQGNEKQLQRINDELVTVGSRLSEAQARLQTLNAVRNRNPSAGELAESLQTLTLQSLRQQYASIKARAADTISRYGGRHPAVVNVKAELKDIEAEIAAEATRYAKAVQTDFDIAREQMDLLEKRKRALKDELAQGGDVLIRLRELEREANSSRAFYDSFLARHKETSAQESLQNADGRIVDRAAVPIKPSKPRPQLVMSLALVGGLGLGLILAFLREYMNKVFRTPEDLERALGLPNLAVLPAAVRPSPFRWRKRRIDDSGILPGTLALSPRLRNDILSSDAPVLHQGSPILRSVLDSRTSAFAQSIFSINNAIEAVAEGVDGQVVMVASAARGEGKSTVAANLALYSASLNRRTLLVDCDIRNPKLSSNFLPNAQHSLIDILAGKVAPADVFGYDAQTGLIFCPSPQLAATPVRFDIFASAPMSAFLQSMRSKFDLIVLDVPALLPHIEGHGLVAHVNKAIVVVQADTTTHANLFMALKMARFTRGRVLGTVLNNSH